MSYNDMSQRGAHAKERAMDLLKSAKNFTIKSAVGAKDVALNMKDIKKDLFVFQKSLRDMIKGMRHMRDQEDVFIAEALQAIRKEIRSPDPKTKAVALQKMHYLSMTGYDLSWCSFHCVEVMSQSKLSLKHTGYLAAQQSFLDNTDVLLLIPNLLKKDLASACVQEAGMALDCLANIMTPDLARDLVGDVFSLLNSNRGYLRKKAVLVLYKAFLRYPEALRPAFPRLTEKIEDSDLAVVSAVVTVLCELCIHNPQNYLPMVPTFYKLLQTSTNNWMTIKLVRIFGHLSPLEPRLGKKLVDPLTQIMTTTPAKSLLYECIRTVTHGLTSHTSLVRLAVEKLREFIDEPDPNLKYLGLQALQDLRASHPRAVAEHKETIFQCLHEGDYTIQTCALLLVRGMVNRRNLQDTVLHLMLTLRRSDQPFRDDVVLTVLEMCSDDRYALLTDFAWYVNVLADLARVPETKHGKLIGSQLVDLTARVSAVREEAVKALRPLILDPALLESKLANATVCHTLQAAVFITGEHAVHVRNRSEMVEALLQPQVINLPLDVQQSYVQAVLKVFSAACCHLAPAVAAAAAPAGPEAAEGGMEEEGADGEAGVAKQAMAEDTDEPSEPVPTASATATVATTADLAEVRALRETIAAHLRPLMRSASIEVSERACHLSALLSLLAMAESMEQSEETANATLLTCMNQLHALFQDELVPVSSKAQKRVPVPAELDLAAPIPAEILKLVSEKDAVFAYDEESDDEYPSNSRKSKKKKKNKEKERYEDAEDSEEESVGAADALTRKTKTERTKAEQQSRSLRKKHVEKHSTFYLGDSGKSKRDKHQDEVEHMVMEEDLMAEAVEPLQLDDDSPLPIPQWSSKAKKAEKKVYEVLGNADADDDDDDEGQNGSSKPNVYSTLDMDVLAPLKDGEELPQTQAYPTYEMEDMYGNSRDEYSELGGARRSSSRRDRQGSSKHHKHHKSKSSKKDGESVSTKSSKKDRDGESVSTKASKVSKGSRSTKDGESVTSSKKDKKERKVADDANAARTEEGPAKSKSSSKEKTGEKAKSKKPPKADDSVAAAE